MTNNLMILLKTELMNRFRFNTFTHEKDPKKKGRIISVAVAFLILMIMLSGYSFGLAYGFGSIGMAYVIPGYALTITSIVTVFFTFFKTNGILFGARDYDMLMALPIRTETIITAKFLSMYVNNLAFAMLVMIPMAVGYSMYAPVHVISILSWILGILAAPLFPMTIAAILGTIIIGIGSGFKHKVLVQVVLTIAVVVGISAISFTVQKTAAQDEALFLAMFADLGMTISNMLHQIYPLSAWFDGAVNHHQIFSVGLLVIVSLAVYGMFTFICGKCYRKINSSLKSHHAVSNYKVGTLKRSSMMSALIWKECKRFTSSVPYMMNIGMGLILALLVSIISIFTGIDKVIATMNIGDMSVISPVLTNIMPFAIAMVVNMCNTTSVSLSLEGRNLWVVQSLPISRKTLLQGKMLFNIVLVLPVSLICNIIFIFQLHVNGLMALLYLVFAVTSVLFSTVWGCFINVHFPNFSWENEIQVIKQGMSSMIGIFSSMIFYILMAVGTIFLSHQVLGEVIVLGASLLTVLMTALVYKMIK